MIVYKTPPERIPDLFALADGLHRKLSDGSLRPITSLNGNKLTTMVEGERICGDEIAWCLNYGCWPKYPLVQLDGDPFNVEPANIYPVRVKRLRFRSVEKGRRFSHSLSPGRTFPTKETCRADWAICAAQHYHKDLVYVLREQEQERKLREGTPEYTEALLSAYDRAQAAKRKRRLDLAYANGLGGRPPRPANVEGRVWHWYRHQWLSVPEPIHVSDDYRLRSLATLQGAVRFEFQPLENQTWAFMPDGTRWVQEERA